VTKRRYTHVSRCRQARAADIILARALPPSKTDENSNMSEVLVENVPHSHRGPPSVGLPHKLIGSDVVFNSAFVGQPSHRFVPKLARSPLTTNNLPLSPRDIIEHVRATIRFLLACASVETTTRGMQSFHFS